MAISRRGFLKAGGAMGVLGALRPISPAWAWNTSQSVAGGDLATLPPEDVWDAPADAIVHRVFTEQGVEGIADLNARLRPWHQNGQALPEGLPADLVAFIEEARRPPAWLDRDRLAAGFDFYELRGTYTGILYGLGSGIMSCAIPDEARAVFHSKGGEDMRDRVSKTAKLGYDIGTRNAFEPDGEMIATCIKTRLAHAAVRHLITSSNRWQGGGSIPAPISQRDLMITWHSLATFIHRTLRSWGVRSPAEQEDGYLHVWQVTAHYLGVQDVYIPATWPDAELQSDQTLDAVLGPTPEGIELAKVLVNLASEAASNLDLGLTRTLITSMARNTVGTNRAGESIADMLQLQKNPVLDPLVQNGWPGFIAMKEMGARFPGANRMYWSFDELLRLGVRWGTSGGFGPVYIEMATANRSEASYPQPY
jgi:hypothetical protein